MSHPTEILGWWFQTFFIFTPIPGEMIQFDEHIFSDGLVQPPPSCWFEYVSPFSFGVFSGSMVVLALSHPKKPFISWVHHDLRYPRFVSPPFVFSATGTSQSSEGSWTPRPGSPNLFGSLVASLKQNGLTVEMASPRDPIAHLT